MFYNLEDDDLCDELMNSAVRPYKLWFNDDNGYILQYDDLSFTWDNIPIDLRNKLNGRQKSLPKVKNITFGPRDTWWVSFQDDTARWSPRLPSHISKYLMKTVRLVLDPIDKDNYFIFKDNGNFIWQVNDDFDEDMKDNDENDDVCYIDPQSIRYTQTTIKDQFSNGHNIEDLCDDLEDGRTTVSDIPMINVVKTRSGNVWSLNNRRLWCFRHARNIDQIPVRIVDKRPSWFNRRIQQLKNPFYIRVRASSEETECQSELDDESDSDEYD
ncbi:unnamed protein product, partial [Rotaria sordida]